MNKKFKGILLSIGLFVASFSFVMAANYDSINTACTGITGTAAGTAGAACTAAGDLSGTAVCPTGTSAVYSGTRVWNGGTSYGGCSCTCVGGSATITIKDNAGLSTRTVPEIIGNVIKVILGLSGTVALILVVVGGIQWMVSKGDTEKIKKARQLMTSGVVGIVIIAAAYAITDFVIKQLSAVV